jgi:hypothetical protein
MTSSNHPSFDYFANHELEVFLGSDRVVRINVDGTCMVRIHLIPGAILCVAGSAQSERR